MLAITTTWLVIFGLLVYVGIPLWTDDDQCEDYHECYCDVCGGTGGTGGICADCWTEFGTGD